ncbi:MAG: hypothetical protein H6740_01905 [Alphaproteobacteria bacterium]|nr:hypothetical protein [Alphaproteobacteria bacterium]
MLTLLALLSLSPLALAQEPAPAASAEEAAKAAFMEGREHFEAERYEQAIVAFNEALRLSGRAGLLLNVALAQEQLGETEAALETLKRFRAEASPEEVAATEARVAELETRLLEGRALQVSQKDPGVRVVEVEEGDGEAGGAAQAESEARADSDSDGDGDSEARADSDSDSEAQADSDAAPAPAVVVLDPDDELSPTLITGAIPPAPPPRWGLIAFGATTAITFSAAAGVTYGVSRSWLEEGDRTPYVITRPLNHASIGLAGVGTALVVAGFTLREPARLSQASLSPSLAWGEDSWVAGARLQLSR